ncbi:MAG: hypothetical protein QM820_46745 [Minicystis sp.]
MNDPESHVVDPALGIAPDRVAGRAIAAQMGAMAVAWKNVFDPTWLDRFTLYRTAHGVLVIAAVIVAGLLLGPIAARARTSGGIWARAIALGIAGGVAVALVGSPLAHIGSTWAPGVTRADIVANDAFAGGFLGFFAGLAAAPLVRHGVHIQRAGGLDVAPRMYIATAATLLVPSILLVLRGIPLLVTAIALTVMAARANRRRIAWMARVRAEEEPGYRYEEVAEEEEIAALPAFAGDAAGARGVVLRAAERVEDRGAHPFRAGGSWIRVARVAVNPGWASFEAQQAMRASAVSGALAGLLLLFVGLVPVMLFVLAISA